MHSSLLQRALFVLTVLALMSVGSNAQAQEEPGTQLAQTEQRRFDIPAGPLASALNRFADETGVQLVYDAALAEGRNTAGVSGTYTPDQALQTLLRGTGLVFQFTNPKTVTIVKTVTGRNPESITLPETQVESKTLRVEETQVTAKRERGYVAEDATTATKIDTPILKTPASTQVVPQQVIEDQAILELRDTYRNVSGVQADFTGGNVAVTESPIIRGFANFFIYRNGFRIRHITPPDFANIERIEILKGPASILYGITEPGGILNIVTKAPVEGQFVRVEQQFGSFNLFRTTIDANSPLTDTLYGRINFAYTTDDTFRDHEGVERVFIAPTLTWRPSDRTELTTDFSYLYEKFPFDTGLLFGADGKPVADISTFLGEPDFRSKREEYFAGYRLVHSFNKQLTFRNVSMLQYTETRLNAFRPSGVLNPDNTVNRSFDRSVPKGTISQTTADLGYKFNLGPTRHGLLAGVDLRLEPEFGNQQDGPRSRGPFPIDIVNPVYGQFGEIVFDNRSDFDRETKFAGIYIQDQIDLLNDRLHLLLGVRFDYVKEKVLFITPTFNFKGSRSDTAFSWRAGALYELTDWLSPYVSISISFSPISPFTTNTEGLNPVEGFQIEGGVKLSFFEERLLMTLAGYQITQDNVPVADPDNPGFSLNGGKLRSRGFEFDVAGEIVPGLGIIGNYSYIDTEVLKSDFLPIGARFRNVPLHSGAVSLAYNFLPGMSLEGLGLSAGVFTATDRLGDDFESFKLGDFARVDLAAWYRRTLPSGQRLKAQFNVINLLDKEYY